MMMTYKIIFAFSVIVLKAAALESSVIHCNNAMPVPETTLDECLKKDSISCLQVQIYRSIKLFLDQDRVDLIVGFSLVREEDSKNEAKARTTEDIISEEQILGAHDFETRESAIESFVYQKISAFFQEHRIRWNVPPLLEGMPAARGMVGNPRADLSQSFRHLVTEARGRKKLLPTLIGVKMEAAVFLALAYVGINLIAKKAIFISLISIGISAFLAARKRLRQRGHQKHKVYDTYVGHDGAGRDGALGARYGHAQYGSHSSSVAHTLAYGSQQVFRK